MNFFNISRATQGLVAYLHDWNQRAKISAKPKIVIAHDPRFFSKEFCKLTARIAVENGCDVFVFEGPRSTPELSFAIRHIKANAGIVITASHNPPHDNGYKVYFKEGEQVIEQHASGIIVKVNEITSEVFTPLPNDRQGKITTLGKEIDEAYMQRLETLILDPEIIRKAKSLRIIYSPLHGTGRVIIEPMLKRLGFRFDVVAEQDRFDGRFSTVRSPNPENAEALTMAIELAKNEDADLVVATDPDCDRMGAAVRGKSGKMKLLTGNQIGSLLAYYRTKTLFDHGVLNKENAARAVIIKTFVTTDLQKAIAEHYGLRCVETLTGFKYIGAKLGKYEQALPENVRQKYVDLSEEETRRLRLTHSSFYVFGGEESYGYSGADFVRDKDGNGAVIMFFEGAEGAGKIRQLVESYAKHPFSEVLGLKVTSVRNFETETIRDIEGDEIPKEKMSIFELEDKTRIAVRGSGTEPKIKYYLFAQRRPSKGKFSDKELDKIKREVTKRLEDVWLFIEKDAHAHLK